MTGYVAIPARKAPKDPPPVVHLAREDAQRDLAERYSQGLVVEVDLSRVLGGPEGEGQ